MCKRSCRRMCPNARLFTSLGGISVQERKAVQNKQAFYTGLQQPKRSVLCLIPEGFHQCTSTTTYGY